MKHLDSAAFARPLSQDEYLRIYDLAQTGLTKREYAAIHLRVPNSGDGQLDAMIREAKRDGLATRAMQGIVAALPQGLEPINITAVCANSYTIADAMLKERENNGAR